MRRATDLEQALTIYRDLSDRLVRMP